MRRREFIGLLPGAQWLLGHLRPARSSRQYR